MWPAYREEHTVLMATQPIREYPEPGRYIPVEEYLSTGYEPDREYDDGVVVERNLGEFEHSFLQTILATVFTNNTDLWGVYALTEQRVQINRRRFLIPDVCVVRLTDPADDILGHPPLIAIEILSPDDSKPQAARKAIEYLNFGVEHVWIVDPRARTAYRGLLSGLIEAPDGELDVPGTPILVRTAELFQKLDRVRAAGGKR